MHFITVFQQIKIYSNTPLRSLGSGNIREYIINIEIVKIKNGPYEYFLFRYMQTVWTINWFVITQISQPEKGLHRQIYDVDSKFLCTGQPSRKCTYIQLYNVHISYRFLIDNIHSLNSSFWIFIIQTLGLTDVKLRFADFL